MKAELYAEIINKTKSLINYYNTKNPSIQNLTNHADEIFEKLLILKNIKANDQDNKIFVNNTPKTNENNIEILTNYAKEDSTAAFMIGTLRFITKETNIPIKPTNNFLEIVKECKKCYEL